MPVFNEADEQDHGGSALPDCKYFRYLNPTELRSVETRCVCDVNTPETGLDFLLK